MYCVYNTFNIFIATWYFLFTSCYNKNSPSGIYAVSNALQEICVYHKLSHVGLKRVLISSSYDIHSIMSGWLWDFFGAF